jgi:hypothetical protein
MGSGKTLTIITFLNIIMNKDQETFVIILSKKALRDNPWFNELK